MTLQPLSGSKGLYLEPRSHDGRSPDEHAAVVWIPQGTLGMAQHRVRTMERVQAVVRNGTKYGIRVAKKDAESAHKKVAPEQEFYNFTVQKVFELRPLPHGTQRAGVQQLPRVGAGRLSHFSRSSRIRRPSSPGSTLIQG